MGIYKGKNQIPTNYSLTRAVLDLLLGMGEEIGFDNKRAWRKALGAPDLPNWRLNRAINYLEKRGQVQKVSKHNSEFIKLTKDGKLKALLFKMRKKPETFPRWDRKWRIIIWDIPEDHRLFRDYLRQWVKDMGFIKLQHSVFIRPYPIPRAAVEYLTEVGLDKYIRFIRVDKIDNDDKLTKNFALANKG